VWLHHKWVTAFGSVDPVIISRIILLGQNNAVAVVLVVAVFDMVSRRLADSRLYTRDDGNGKRASWRAKDWGDLEGYVLSVFDKKGRCASVYLDHTALIYHQHR
jgi:hypothetical protein